MGGLFIGLQRADAARFSFLLGLPAIGASGLLQLFALLEGGLGRCRDAEFGVGDPRRRHVSGYLSIGFLLRFLQRHGTYCVCRSIASCSADGIFYSLYG